MTERIAYSTWGRLRKGRVRRAHIIVGAVTSEKFEGTRYKTKCHPGANISHLMRSEHVKFVKEVDDLPKRTMPCEGCFKCCDVPYWVAIATKEYMQPKTKVCSKKIGCGKRKPLEEFYSHPDKKYGRNSICIECDKARAKVYPRRTDNKSLRVTPPVHQLVKDFARSKRLGVQEAAIRLIRAGLDSFCVTPECMNKRVRNGMCEDHYRQIVERVA